MKKIIVSTLVALVVFCVFGVYLYWKPHKNVDNIKASQSISAVELANQFLKNEPAANKIFLDKVIEVTGVVREVNHTDSTANIELDSGNPTSGVSCSFTFIKFEQIQLPKKSTLIKIKGRCSGFLADVNLLDCVVEQ